LEKLPREELGIPCIVAYGNQHEDLYIVEAQVLHDSEMIYEEPVGVLIKPETGGNPEVFRGAELFQYLKDAISNVATIPNEHTTVNIPDNAKVKAKGIAEDLLRYLSSDYLKYVKEPCSKGWRDPDKDWLPRLESMEVKIQQLLGVVRRITSTPAEAPRPDSVTIKMVERQTMKIAMEYEKAHGREPIDVSEHEHYDIKSLDPKTGEVRHIEVKGHEGRAFTVELTEDEYNEATKRRETYWLYLVYNVTQENPEILAIRDPLSNMKVEIVTERRYMLTL
jgi:hypothetical protein